MQTQAQSAFVCDLVTRLEDQIRALEKTHWSDGLANLGLRVLRRLGVRSIRIQVGYDTSNPRREQGWLLNYRVSGTVAQWRPRRIRELRTYIAEVLAADGTDAAGEEGLNVSYIAQWYEDHQEGIRAF